MAYSSSAVVLSDKERFVNFFRTAPSDASFVPAIVSLLQTYGWTRMVVITQDQNLFTDVGVNAFVWNIVDLCVLLYTTIPFVSYTKLYRSKLPWYTHAWSGSYFQHNSHCHACILQFYRHMRISALCWWWTTSPWGTEWFPTQYLSCRHTSETSPTSL